MLGSKMSYSDLLAYFPPRPIETGAVYWETQAVIDELLSSRELSADEQTYLNLLSILIERHDEENAIAPDLRGVELLRELIREQGLKQKDLLPIFRHESTISDILNSHRKLTVEHIERLSEWFGLPPALFFNDKSKVQQYIPKSSPQLMDKMEELLISNNRLAQRVDQLAQRLPVQ